MEEFITRFSVFLLVFVRVSAFFVTMPLFSYRTLPSLFRIGLAFFVSVLMYASVYQGTIDINAAYFLLMLKEAAVGLFIGFIAYMVLTSIQVAGNFIDFQMGFAIANIIDPQTGVQSPLIGQYLYIFSLLLLLAVDGHHMLLNGIFYSYQFIPLDQASFGFANANLAEYIAKSFSMLFLIAFQISVPVVAVLFLVDVALGIVARTVPQMNVFVVGFPIKIAVSFIVLFIVMGVIFGVIQQLFETMGQVMRDVMEMLGSQS
ncbi:flagellar biosynthetic protein FliR [Siminovitchia sp. FSL H7-0308]|uniref:Flagellar biosynthetic protein FliR n=1 Tax=Siminovitchia thermophila TaxID=1245522 RepID=A0ABS2RAT1_9BACI|nr:flagellar biosynthetic protein FliR [Siminovitchia thermophila]MBM7716465.1 flagellar biosynthetic protein FliR [Siminovitchia thermophila]ONK23226.1 flagellar biosynthetic protein FliR [Bacillus sp. VT-16-64]